MPAEWITDMSHHGVALQYRKVAGHSRAEAEWRVAVLREGGRPRVAWRGWCPGAFETWKATIATEERK